MTLTQEQIDEIRFDVFAARLVQAIKAKNVSPAVVHLRFPEPRHTRYYMISYKPRDSELEGLGSRERERLTIDTILSEPCPPPVDELYTQKQRATIEGKLRAGHRIHPHEWSKGRFPWELRKNLAIDVGPIPPEVALEVLQGIAAAEAQEATHQNHSIIRQSANLIQPARFAMPEDIAYRSQDQEFERLLREEMHKQEIAERWERDGGKHVDRKRTYH